MVGAFFFHSFMYIYIFVHNYCFHSVFWPCPWLLFFPLHLSISLTSASWFLTFPFTVNHPLSPSVSLFSLDYFPISLQSSPLSFLPHSISLPSLLSSLPPSFLPQHQRSSHLPLPLLSAKQFIGSCSLIYQSNSSFPAAFGGRARGKTTGCLPKETSGSHRH